MVGPRIATLWVQFEYLSDEKNSATIFTKSSGEKGVVVPVVSCAHVSDCERIIRIDAEECRVPKY